MLPSAGHSLSLSVSTQRRSSSCAINRRSCRCDIMTVIEDQEFEHNPEPIFLLRISSSGDLLLLLCYFISVTYLTLTLYVRCRGILDIAFRCTSSSVGLKST